jgi:hypothetical protein
MKTGPKGPMGPRLPLEEQIFSQVQVDWSKPAEAENPKQESCWEWQGYVPTKPGLLPYGRVKVNGDRVPRPVHRLVYELFVGPIPEGLVVDHLCRNARCCRPKHLRCITPSENSDGGFVQAMRAKTQCANGHPFSDTNLFERRMKNGKIYRGCKQCRRDNNKRQREKRKQSGPA